MPLIITDQEEIVSPLYVEEEYMVTKFVFISDIHIQNGDRDIVAKAEKIIDYLSSSEKFDDLFFLFAGDIAHAGSAPQYEIASEFIIRLFNQAKEKLHYSKHISFFMVPGNHDINFCQKKRSRADIFPMVKKCKEGDYSLYYSELEKYSDFIKFAQKNKCFKDTFDYDTKNVDTCGQKIQFNLLNSTIFSVFDPEGDKDFGAHILSKEAIDSLRKKEDQSFVFTIMHQSPDFFDSAYRENIAAAIDENTNILLLGHNHVPECSGRKSMIGTTTTVQGGRFSDSTKIDSEFFDIDCDWNNKKYYVTRVVWDNLTKIYHLSSRQEYSIEKRPKIQEPFLQWLEEGDTVSGLNKISDYFVFPTLSIKSGGEETPKKDIQSIEEFLEITKQRQIIEIAGNELSGKTTLVKYLYNYFANNGKIPLVVTEEDMNRKAENVVKNAYKREYSYNEIDFDSYMQKAKELRIVIAEDLHLLGSVQRDSFIKYLVEKFDCIIYTTANTVDYDLAKSLEQFILDQELNVIRLIIEPFYQAKRKPLIKKVCDCLCASTPSEEVEEQVAKVESFISAQIRVFDLSPQFIVMFTRSYVLNLVKSDTSNVFSAVFESNILSALNKIKNKSNTSDLMQILQELAWFIHFHKKYPVAEADFMRIIDDYNQAHRTNLIYSDVTQELIKGRILKNERGFIQFFNKGYLSYFAARWLNRMLQNGEGKSELQSVIDNLCYNINADVLLFLTFITESIYPLSIILESERNFSKDILEFSIDNQNIACLFFKKPPKLKMKAPDDGDRKKREIQQTYAEKDLIERDTLRTINLYEDNHLDDFIARQTCLFKYLEIISKILPNFFHLLKSNQQDEFVKEVYVLANKVIYSVFKPIDDNFEQIVQEIKKLIQGKEISFIKDEDDIKDKLFHFMSRLMLVIWDYCSGRLATDDRSINALNVFPFNDNTNYRIQNTIMQGAISKFEPFVKKVEAIYDDKKVPLISKYLLQRIFMEFCINNKISYKGIAQRYVDKYLGGEKALISHKATETRKV